MQDSKLILICGRNAVLSQELEEMLWPAGYQVRCLSGIELGLLDIDRLRRNLTALAPALVINTIGYASPDSAENHRTLTQARNHWSVGDLAEVAGAQGIPLLHLSSDQVFAGDKLGPYLETDQPDAISVFGQAQAAGEAAVCFAGGWVPAGMVVQQDKGVATGDDHGAHDLAGVRWYPRRAARALIV